MREEISIEGTLLMLDDATPYVAVPVQAIRDGEVIATTLSDNGGKYQFMDLKPGCYQLRCQVLGGYVYYKATDRPLRFTSYDSVTDDPGDILDLQRGSTLKNIDLRFAPFRKGTWRSYTYLDGLADNNVWVIHRHPDGVLWFATGGGGVSLYDGIAWTSLDTRDGLPGNRVTSILQDDDGFLWFGTSGGITRYRPSTRRPNAYILSVTTGQTYRLGPQEARLKTEGSGIPAFTVRTRVTIEYSSIDFKTIPEKRQYRCRVYEARGDEHAPLPPRSLLPPSHKGHNLRLDAGGAGHLRL